MDQWATDLAQLAEAMRDEQFNLFLKHAEVPLDRKIESLATVLPEVDPMVRNLGSLLITRNSVDSIGDVATAYSRLVDERLGRQQIEVTTAVELEAGRGGAHPRVRGRAYPARGCDVHPGGRLHPGRHGIQIGDRLMDGSTRSKLEELRKQIRLEGSPG